MHKKALTVAIAGALAIPMAAHAVDVTLSGHVNRALLITDSDNDSSTSANVSDNGSSGTRIRVKGTGEMMDGGSAGVLLEYSAAPAAWASATPTSGSPGDYGKISIGQGDQGGEGSVYKGGAAVLGTGHGQENAGVTKRKDPVTKKDLNYYTSLDGGSARNERIRYDTPAVGPLSAAVSVGNGDQVSVGISMSQDFGGTSFSAGIGTIQWGGSDKSTISGSAGVSLPSGISISGAWGSGKDFTGMTIPAVAAKPNTAAMDEVWNYVDTNLNTTNMVSIFGSDGNDEAAADSDVGFTAAATSLQATIAAGAADEATEQEKANAGVAQATLMTLFETFKCDPEPMLADGTVGTTVGDVMTPDCARALYANSTPEMMDGMPGSDKVPTTTDPSFFQVAVSYAFGDTSVGVSWYQSSDLVNEGSELTAIGAGVDHQPAEARHERVRRRAELQHRRRFVRWTRTTPSS